MELEPIRLSEDLKLINEWRFKRSIELTTARDLPAVGYFVSKYNKPIAAAFLRQCEGGYGILDSIITDPDASPADRYEALDILFVKFIELAKGFNLRALIGTSIDAGTLERSKKFGFKESNHKLMTLNLGE